ncbi:MAG: hypothetical protein IJ532_04320 [Alphaproteobacteria bacterium]|nr:hypothetical protein [Alphaproteobacteria bacterium]
MSMQNLLEKLFSEGNCLTYDWYFSARRKAEQMCKQFKAENPHGICFVQNSKVTVPLFKHTDFQYFSNGALVIYMPPHRAEEVIKKARKFLASHGCEIKYVYAPQDKEEWRDYFKLLIDIHDKTKKLSINDEDLMLCAFNTPEEFADYCFKDNNVLLTASKEENFNPKYRRMLALFGNGLYIIDEQYKHGDSFYGDVEVAFFENRICEYPIMRAIYVPQIYLRALYKRAEQYNWYISPEKAEERLPQITASELETIGKYTDDILPNRSCISILTPRITYNDILLDPILTSPDYHRYVLFDDGKLVLSQKYYCDEMKQKHLLEDLKRSFPHLKFAVEQVSDYCVDYLYREIYKRQKSARDIYLEMMRQKALLISDVFGVPIVLAQDAAAQFAGWHSWENIQTVTVIHARHLIAKQQELDIRAEKNGYKNDVIYNATAYFELLKAQNIPYENAQSVYAQLKANSAKAKHQ